MKKIYLASIFLLSFWSVKANEIIVNYYSEADNQSVAYSISYELNGTNYEASVTSINVNTTLVIIPENVEFESASYRVVSIANSPEGQSCVTVDDEIETFSISFPSTCTRIGDYSFSEVSKLTSISDLDNIEYIGNYAFYQAGLCSLELPSRVSESVFRTDGDIEIGDYAFYQCPITTLNVGSPKIIGDYAFYGLPLAGELYLPCTLYKIGNYAFANCSNITKIQFSQYRTGFELDSKYHLGNYAFMNCTSLETIDFSYGNICVWGNSLFVNCPNLQNYQVLGKNVDEDDCIQSENRMRNGLLSHGDGDDVCTLVAIMPKHDKLPTTINRVLSKIRKISDMSLSYYPHSDITIDVKDLGNYVLINSCVEYVTFGENVETIESDPFFNCNNLKKVTCLSTIPPSCPASPFSHQDITLFVPAGCLSVYRNAPYWKDFGDIKESQIFNIAFYNKNENIYIGASKQLELMVEGGTATKETIEWSSNNESIATVNENGVVTALAEGTALITAHTKDGSDLSAICTITVSTPKYCENPVITFKNGIVSITCPTEGATIHYTSNLIEGLEGDVLEYINITPKLVIKAYATAKDHEASETVAQIFDIFEKSTEGDSNGDGVVDMVDIVRTLEIIKQK